MTIHSATPAFDDARTEAIVRRVLDRLGLTNVRALIGIADNYTTATQPAATAIPSGTIVFVSDAAAGSKFQGSTGAAWVNLG